MKKSWRLLAASVLVSSCVWAQPGPTDVPPSPPMDPAMQPPPMPPPDLYSGFFAMCAESDRLMQSGDTNGAIMMLDNMFMNINNFRAMTFDNLLKAMIASGNIEGAKARYLGMAMQDKELAQSGCNLIRQYYQGKGDVDGALAWAQEIMKMDLSTAILVEANAWYVEACCSKEAYDKALEILPTCLKNFDGTANRRIFSGPIRVMIAAGKTDAAEKLLNAIAKQGEKQPELKAMVAMERTALLWKLNRLSDAELNFVKTAPIVPDGELQQVLGQLGSQAATPETSDALNRMCEYVIKNMKDKPASRQDAAIRLLENAKKAGKGGDISKRIEFLFKCDFPPTTLLNLYSTYFYDVISLGARDDLRNMLATGNKLFPKLDKLDDKRAIRILELDGIFVMDDYEGALKLIESNRAIWEKDWEPMADNKIRAHLALQKSKLETGEKQKELKLETVKRFRTNLDYIAKWEDPQLEPLTGLIYTKEMYLGLNLKRIGDILKSVGDDAGAEASFKESEGYYKKALAETKSDSREYAFINEMIAAIYKGPAKERQIMPPDPKDEKVKGKK